MVEVVILRALIYPDTELLCLSQGRNKPVFTQSDITAFHLYYHQGDCNL